MRSSDSMTSIGLLGLSKSMRGGNVDGSSKYELIPREVRDRGRFCFRGRHGQPVDIEGRNLSWDSPQKFYSYDVAMEFLERYPRLELVWLCKPESGLFVIDLDHCIIPGTRLPLPGARNIIRAFNTYAEYSRSGEGVHVIGHGSLPEFRGCGGVCSIASGDTEFRVELYFHKTITLTGQALDGFAEVADCGNTVRCFCERWFKHKIGTIDEEALAATASLSDDEVLRRFSKCKNYPEFLRPPETTEEGKKSIGKDESSVDFGILAALIRISGCKQQVRRIFSGSVRWDEKRRKKKGDSYIDKTIDQVLRRIN